MARSSKSRFAVLGILTFGPMSGYDIRKVFGLGPGHFWQESYGQIYPILRALQGEGLVTRSAERGREPRRGRPPRKVYALTAKGRAALRNWLPDPPEAQPPRHEILLKLFFGRHAAPGVCAGHLQRERERLLGQRERYGEIERLLRERCAGDPDAPFQLITLRYGQHLTDSLVDWCEESLRALARAGAAKVRRAEKPARRGARSRVRAR